MSKFKGKRTDNKGELTNEYKQFIATKIYAERQLKGLNQKDFAKAVGVSNQTFNNLEQGKGSLKIEYLYQIANFCGCDIGYLLGECDNRTYKATDIYNATGLSEEAIYWLTSKQYANKMVSIYEQENGIDLKAELIDFIIRDFRYARGIMQSLLYFKYEKSLVDEYKDNEWFAEISEIVRKSYEKNQYTDNHSSFRTRQFDLSTAIMSDVYEELREKYGEKADTIFDEIDEWMLPYIEWVIYSDINKANLQNLIMKYLERYIFEV